MDNIVPKALEEYAAAHTSPHSPLLEELEEYTIANCELSRMLIGRVEGGFLRMLVRLMGAKRILEIGTFTGYSALSMAEALPEDGTLVTCDKSVTSTRIARSFFDRSRHGRKIEIRLGSALKTIEALPRKRLFDLVFIDADKEGYVAYYEAVLPLVRQGGLIVADNALWSGRVIAPHGDSDQAVAAFNDRIEHDPRVENVMLTVRDGMMLIRKL